MRIPENWLPRSVTALRTYSARRFSHDLAAGVTVGLVALPLAMAFGIASGVTPQAGLYTAVVAGFLISALGGSRVQIGGPTGAFVVIVAGIVARFGTEGLALVTLMAGGMLVIMGITGLGAAVKFIPRPVIIGFTNGIALLIASTQIKDFLGLRTGAVPSSFLPRMKVLAENIGSVHWPALAIGCATLAIILLWPRVSRRIPGSILAVLGCTAVAVLMHLHVETVGTRFGGIPQGFPPFTLPHLHAEHILPLLPSALHGRSCSAAIESLLSAVVADGMAGDRHNSNVELVAQGVANIASPLFGGIPATGAIARTATNIRSGAVSPVSGMVHALTLLAILLVAAPAARFIPLATLAAVLFVVAYNMGEWREIGIILRLAKTDIAVWATDLRADGSGRPHRRRGSGHVARGAPLYLPDRRDHQRLPGYRRLRPRWQSARPAGQVRPPYVRILRIHGPFLFGATEKLTEATANLNDFPQIVILRLRNMTALDATGLHTSGYSFQADARFRPDSPPLRRARSARSTVGESRFCRRGGTREYSAQCAGRTRSRSSHQQQLARTQRRNAHRPAPDRSLLSCP
jgi:SulP family sulfate permease